MRLSFLGLLAIAVVGAACSSSAERLESSVSSPTSSRAVDEAAVSSERADEPSTTEVPDPKLVIAVFDVGEHNEFWDDLIVALQVEAETRGIETVSTLLVWDEPEHWATALGEITEPGDVVATMGWIFESAGERVLEGLDVSVISMLYSDVPEHPMLVGVVSMESIWDRLFAELDRLATSHALCVDSSSGVSFCSYDGGRDNVSGFASRDFVADQIDLSFIPDVPYDAIISDVPVELLERARAELGDDQIVIVSGNPAEGVANSRSPVPVQPDIAVAVVDIALAHLAGRGLAVDRRVLEYHFVGDATVRASPSPLELPAAIARAVPIPVDVVCETSQPVAFTEPSVTVDLDGDGQTETLVAARGSVRLIAGDLTSRLPTMEEPAIADLDGDGEYELLTSEGIYEVEGCVPSIYDLTELRALFGLGAGSVIPAWTGECVRLEQGLGLLLLRDTVLELRADRWHVRAAADEEPILCTDLDLRFAVG